MQKFYIGLTVISLIILYCAWVRVRRDYRCFQRIYNVKLPIICHVMRSDKSDNIYWGARRYLHQRTDGKRDRRYGFNIKWWFPTIIYVGGYKCKIWDINRARAVVRAIEPQMDLSLDKIQFLGEIVGDPMQFFGDSNKIFIRWCGKLFAFYGYQCVLWRDPMNVIAINNTHNFTLHCELRTSSQPVTPRDILRLTAAYPLTQWVYITTGVFTESAVLAANKHNVLLMDRNCLDITFMYRRPMFK